MFSVFKIINKIAKWFLYFIMTVILARSLWIARVIFKKTWQASWPLIQRWGALSMKIFGIKIDLEDPHQYCSQFHQQFIVIANHRSWFDQLSIVSIFKTPLHFLGKAEYLKYPYLGMLLRLGGYVPVNNKQLNETDKNNLDFYLQRGDSVLFFFEGTRGSFRSLLPFRAGAYNYARKYNIPILPLYIFGAESILRKNNSLLKIRRGRIKIVVDPPFIVDDDHMTMLEIEKHYRKRHNFLYDTYNEPPIEKEWIDL